MHCHDSVDDGACRFREGRLTMDLLLRHGTGTQPRASRITACLVDGFLERV
jgi:hypothetical protein